MKRAIVITVDGLHAGMLGCYGNAWIATPAVDRLAASGFTFDQAFLDTTQPDLTLSAIWAARPTLLAGGGRGATANQPSRPQPEFDELWPVSSAVAERTLLVCDAHQPEKLPLAEQAAEVIQVADEDATAPAENVAETWLGRCFARAVELIERSSDEQILWMHLTSLTQCWDAPYELRQRYAEEDDPPPYEGVRPVAQIAAEGSSLDPDERLRHRFAYAGQISVLDTCLAVLLDAVDTSSTWRDAVLLLAGVRGWPLGEHGSLGWTGEAGLFNEVVQMPLIIRGVDPAAAAMRSQALVQPADVGATLQEWFTEDRPPTERCAASLVPLIRDTARELRWWACTAGAEDQAGLRTAHWYYQRTAAASESERPLRRRLFVKPDDRWEQNDVADRAAEIAAAMDETLRRAEAAAAAGALHRLEPAEPRILSPAG